MLFIEDSTIRTNLSLKKMMKQDKNNKAYLRSDMQVPLFLTPNNQTDNMCILNYKINYGRMTFLHWYTLVGILVNINHEQGCELLISCLARCVSFKVVLPLDLASNDAGSISTS